MKRSPQTIEEARAKEAALINAQEDEIIFTSGGTEVNNWALKGAMQANRSRGNHLITSSIEHFSIMHAIKALEKQGMEVTRLPVDNYGVDGISRMFKRQSHLRQC